MNNAAVVLATVRDAAEIGVAQEGSAPRQLVGPGPLVLEDVEPAVLVAHVDEPVVKDREGPRPHVGTVPEPLDHLLLRPEHEDAYLHREPRVRDVPRAQAGRVPLLEEEIREDEQLMGRELPEEGWVAGSADEAVLREVLRYHVLSDDLRALLVAELEDLSWSPWTRRGPVSLAGRDCILGRPVLGAFLPGTG